MFAIILITYTLAVLVGIGSVSFYVAAFFYPEVSRPRDVIWSALGLLYALVLWFCAAQMTPALLLGQLIAAVLLSVLGWQTLSIRREKTPVYQQTPVVITPEVAGNWAKNTINQLRIAPAEPVPLTLEKRSLSEFPEERLGIPLDPRRRPAYEYEFVEDGLWADAEDEANRAEETAQLSLSLAEDEPLPVDVTPPAAIADIISVEAPEREDELESSERELTAQEDESIDSESVEAALPEEPVSKRSASTNNLESDDLELDDLEPDDSDSEANSDRADDGWNDSDWIEEDSTGDISTAAADPDSSHEQPASPRVAPPKEKPSLIALPVILAGWVKDVVASLTKPKPSKPVIDIPRREAAVPETSVAEAATPKSPVSEDIDDAVPVSSAIATPQTTHAQKDSFTQDSTQHPPQSEPTIPQQSIPQPVPSESNWDDEPDAREDSNWDD